MGYYGYMREHADILIIATFTLLSEVAILIAIYPYL